jgi:hypothetical protein
MRQLHLEKGQLVEDTGSTARRVSAVDTAVIRES